MSNILFVCYVHGCRGEFLSHKIAQQDIFKSLEAKVVANRTIITNDFFNKDFLKLKYPIIKRFPNENIVVPSHYFYDELIRDFPNAVFVAIDHPTDIDAFDAFNAFLYQRFWNYSTKDKLELIGEVKEKYYMYNKFTNKEKDNKLEKIIYNVLKIKNITFGDIVCIVQDIKPTEENIKKLFIKICNRRKLKKLSALTRAKSLVIPYEEVKNFSINTIVDYFKKCSGSL